MTSVLITGAAGFAGSHLVELLARGDAMVWALHRPGGRAIPSLTLEDPDTVVWRAVDLLDREALAAVVREANPSVIYHCGGAAHVGESWRRVTTTLEANIIGTHNVLEAMRGHGLDVPIVIPGSATVYRPADRALTEEDPVGPQNPYAISKLAQEMLGIGAVSEDGMQVMLPRAFNHIGPRQDDSYVASALAHQLARIEAGLEPPVVAVGNLDARRDITDVRDMVRAYVALAEKGTPGRIYNVCRGDACAVRELLDALLAEARVPVTVTVDRSRLRPNDTPLVLGNPQRIRHDTGWAATIPLQKTIGDLLAYWRTRVQLEPSRS
jgi:GDP-4-dehydro-6-deoxy-D-mannose reductase